MWLGYKSVRCQCGLPLAAGQTRFVVHIGTLASPIRFFSAVREGKRGEEQERTIPMKSIMLAGAAMLAFTAGVSGIAVAQGMPDTMSQPPADSPPPGDPAVPATPATPASPGTSAATPAMPATPADPNAGQPTGAVPPETGMAPAPAGVPRDSTAPMGSSANPVTVGGNMTPPPTTPKEYPLCSRTVQDSCINPGEARGVRKATRRRH